MGSWISTSSRRKLNESSGGGSMTITEELEKYLADLRETKKDAIRLVCADDQSRAALETFWTLRFLWDKIGELEEDKAQLLEQIDDLKSEIFRLS